MTTPRICKTTPLAVSAKGTKKSQKNMVDAKAWLYGVFRNEIRNAPTHTMLQAMCGAADMSGPE